MSFWFLRRSVMKKLALLLIVLTLAISMSGVHAQGSTTLVIESWRTGDETVWDTIIADFNKTHPEITVKFQPTKPDQYNGALSAKLGSGTAGDIITCRPFTLSLDMFTKGQLLDVPSLPGMDNS